MSTKSVEETTKEIEMAASLEDWMKRYGKDLNVFDDEDDEDLKWVGAKEKAKGFSCTFPIGVQMHPEAALLLVAALRIKYPQHA